MAKPRARRVRTAHWFVRNGHGHRGGPRFAVAGFDATLGMPTIATVDLALWTLDDDERHGREKRESNDDFQ